MHAGNERMNHILIKDTDFFLKGEREVMEDFGKPGEITDV